MVTQDVVALMSEFVCIYSNTKKSDGLLYFLIWNHEILPDDVIAMTRHGKIDGLSFDTTL